jgi:hypothetical protein
VRRGSLGSLSAPSPLRTNSATSYNVPGAFPSSFAAAASVASPTPSSPVSFGKLQAASSGALSPAMSHSNSGHLIATAVSGAVAFGAMSPASSGHLYGSPPPVQAYTVPQHAPAAQHFSPPHEVCTIHGCVTCDVDYERKGLPYFAWLQKESWRAEPNHPGCLHIEKACVHADKAALDSGLLVLGGVD